MRLFHLVLESHDGRALVPIPKRSVARERHRHCEPTRSQNMTVRYRRSAAASAGGVTIGAVIGGASREGADGAACTLLLRLAISRSS